MGLAPGSGPDGFLWGTATAAFQVEGARTTGGRGRSIWDDLQDVPGAIANGDRADHCGMSWEHWHRDVELLRDLGVDAYRFSISWPRIVPDGDGTVDEAALDHYDRMVDDLLDIGVQPVVTLFHWDLPSALQAGGGFTQRSTGEAYARYAEAVVRRLGDRVPAFVTHNEPAVFAFIGHVVGVFPPATKDRATALQVAHELLVSHGMAVDVVREHAPSADVGITLDVNHVVPADPDDPAHVEAAGLYRGYWSQFFLDALHGRGYPEHVLRHAGADAPTVRPGDHDLITRPTDFLGINHYRRDTCVPADTWNGADVVVPDGVPTTHIGWEVVPEAFGQVLTDIHREYAPERILVTENGAAYDDAPDADGFVDDQDRVAYLGQYLDQLLAARARGVPVEGWFVWSLLDNFEWAEGFDKRFGLVRTVAGTPVRVPKASFRWYRDRIAAERP